MFYDGHMKQVRDRYAKDDYVRTEAEDRMNRLILGVIDAGRQEDLEKAARDKNYREMLYKEFGIG